VIVGVAAHIFVGGKGVGGEFGRQAFEFGFHIAVGEQVGGQQALAGDFEPGLGMFARQVEEAEAGTVGLLRVRAGLEQGGEVSVGVGTDFGGFALKPVFIGVQHKTMVGGHVFGLGRKAPLDSAARV
jgi:hypothetical protein